MLRIASANGHEIGARQVPDLFGVLGAGFGSRKLARLLCAQISPGQFLLKSAIAYGATKAIGEAARARFAEGDGLSVRSRT